MADLEGGRTVPMLCSTLTMAFSTVAGTYPLPIRSRSDELTLYLFMAYPAALLIAVVPAVSGASYLQPDFAPQMALLTADTSRPELPSMISIGMARICYKSPGERSAVSNLYVITNPTDRHHLPALVTRSRH